MTVAAQNQGGTPQIERKGPGKGSWANLSEARQEELRRIGRHTIEIARQAKLRIAEERAAEKREIANCTKASKNAASDAITDEKQGNRTSIPDASRKIVAGQQSFAQTFLDVAGQVIPRTQIKAIVKRLAADAAAGEGNATKELLDRIMGKAVQTVQTQETSPAQAKGAKAAELLNAELD